MVEAAGVEPFPAENANWPGRCSRWCRCSATESRPTASTSRCSRPATSV